MRNTEIIRLLAPQEFVSGEFISNQLSISRTAVWKHIKSLQEKGYQIESKRNIGYRLTGRPEAPLPEEIIPNLKTETIGSDYFFFNSLESTNTYAKQLVSSHTKEGTIIIAETQEKGKGRKDRVWKSPHGGLWLSIILFPKLPPQKAMYVTMVASCAITQAIREVCGLEPEIKWPNDILIQKKKICGILSELDAEMDRIHYSIIGIGINVNNTIPEDLSDKATTLSLEQGRSINRKDLLISLLHHFDFYYQYIKKQNLKYIREQWKSSSQIIGKEIIVQGERERIQGVVKDIDENGALIVIEDDKVKNIITGDIEYL